MTKSWLILITIVLVGLLAVKLRQAPSRLLPSAKPPPEAPLPDDPEKARAILMQECRQALTPRSEAPARSFAIHKAGLAEELFVRSFYCEALAEKDPAVCAELDKVAWKLGPTAGECRADYPMNMAMALAAGGKSAEAVAACRKSLAAAPELPADAHEELCQLVVKSYQERREGVCGQASKLVKPGVSAEEFLDDCRQSFRGLGGPGECGGIKDLRAKTACFDTAAILSAAAAQAPSLCQGSELCAAVMTASTDACGSLREKAEGLICSLAAQEEIRNRFLIPTDAGPAANP